MGARDNCQALFPFSSEISNVLPCFLGLGLYQQQTLTYEETSSPDATPPQRSVWLPLIQACAHSLLRALCFPSLPHHWLVPR